MEYYFSCFPESFPLFFYPSLTSFPLHQKFLITYFLLNMVTHILIFPAFEFTDLIVLINHVSIHNRGIHNRQITKAYMPSNETNISNLLFLQEFICFLHFFRVRPSIICQHVFLGLHF
jgi:hypothetical protein